MSELARSLSDQLLVGACEADERRRAYPIEILIVAGVRLYQDGLALALSADPRFRVVAIAGGHLEGLARIAALSRCPDVAVIDVGPPLDCHGARALRARAPRMRLLALAIGDAEDDLVRWAEAGVSGFVTRETPLEGLMQSIESIATNGSVCPPDVIGRLLRRMESMANARAVPSQVGEALTDRERDVVALINCGRSNKEIARELQLSVATVKNHVHSILDKLHVARRGEAAAAMRGIPVPERD
jgi:two-component system, NarL family, nitrate/nitrite response regulator NarL